MKNADVSKFTFGLYVYCVSAWMSVCQKCVFLCTPFARHVDKCPDNLKDLKRINKHNFLITEEIYSNEKDLLSFSPF